MRANSQECSKSELRKKDVTVYDEAGNPEGRYNVKFMPDSDHVREEMKHHWQEAKERMQTLSGGDFWQVHVKKQLERAKDIVKECTVKRGVCRIKDDYADMKAKNKLKVNLVRTFKS